MVIILGSSQKKKYLPTGGSQPVGCYPLGDQATLSQGSSKIIRKHGYLHYDS